MTAGVDWGEVWEAVRSFEVGECVLGVSVVAPSGDRFDHNADRPFVAASTVKIPIMVQLFAEVEAGERTLEDRWVMREADKAPGSGVMLHLHDGMQFTLADLVYLMISISDNTATNVLIEMLGMAAIRDAMGRLGTTGSTLGRKMMGRAAQGDEKENWATPRDYARTVTALLGCRTGSAQGCSQMLKLLELQQNDRRIARFLPKAERPLWGSKTGSVAGVCNDVGFVMTPGGAVVLSVFCENPPDAHAGEAIIGEIARAALAAVSTTARP